MRENDREPLAGLSFDCPEWRRRESNPRPRTRQEGLLQAQPAFMSRRVAPRRPVLRWPVRRWSPLWPARTPRPPGKPPSEGLPPRRPGGATRYVIRLRSEREIQIGLRIWCLLDDLRGPPASSACYPTHRIRPRRSQDAPESPSSVARPAMPFAGVFSRGSGSSARGRSRGGRRGRRARAACRCPPCRAPARSRP